MNMRFDWQGEKVIDFVSMAAEQGLLEGAELILQTSGVYVPHQEGILQDTGETSFDPVEMKAAVCYDTPYAKRQHEDTTLRHTKGKSAKYLERATNEKEQEAFGKLADRLKSALHG